ncbi:MAG: hypothetical protein ACPGU5_04465 [Lishizhenia sp.]
MNNAISVIFKKYVLAAIITAVGLGLLIYGLKPSSQQNALFNIAAANILLAGVLAILLSSGALKRGIVFAIGGVATLITIFLLFTSWNQISEAQAHILAREKSEIATTQVLTEIRDIQKAFYEVNGNYAKDWNELKNFFESGKVLEARPMGAVPERPILATERTLLYGPRDKRLLDLNMTEWEATQLARMGAPGKDNDLVRFKRDTVEIPFKENFLANKRYQKNRKDGQLGSFLVDSVSYVPMTGGKKEWTLETQFGKVIDGDTVSVTSVTGFEPIPKIMGTNPKLIGFGDLSTGSLKGTWE